MIACGSLEFAQARVHARQGQRADDATWQRLETTRDYAALLEVARQSVLRPWLSGITSPGQVRQIEAALRGHWRAAVAEAAAWMPAAWQPALSWCAVLPDLPLLQHLARGGDAAPWMADDAVWRLLAAAPAAEQAALLAAGPCAALAAAWARPDELPQAWLAEWRRRLPGGPGSADTDDSLRQLGGLLRAHAEAFVAAPPGPGALLRRALQGRLVQLLHRVALQPAVAFIHLALCALDFERLRGELLVRALFPQAGAH